MKAFTSFDQLLEVAREQKPKDGFSAIASNPPYQVNIGGEDNSAMSVPVWQEFLFVSEIIADKISFVNPGRWLKGGAGMNSVRKILLNNTNLVKIIYFEKTEEVFQGVDFGPVSFEYLDKLKVSSSPKIYTRKNGNWSNPVDLMTMMKHDILLSINDSNLIDKILNKNLGPNFENTFQRGGDDFATKRITSVPKNRGKRDYGLQSFRFVRDKDYFLTEEEISESIDYVKIYFLESAGKVNWRYLPLNELEETNRNKKFLSSWVALVPNTNANIFYRNLGPICEPGSLYAQSWVGRAFETRDELLGFRSYLTTYFYRYLVSIRSVSHIALANIHRFVPDLATVTNPRTGLVGYESDWTDDDLKMLFEGVLTEEDWKYIEKVAVESDPAGAKK